MVQETSSGRVLGKAVKASDLFIAALENEGIEYIFGVPGEENLDFVESLRQSSIKLLVTRHEQTAGFMAATMGRLTGKAGVALATLGPGATNFTTAASYGHLGAFPVLFITGQKPILKSKQGAFQIVDIVKLFHNVTKFCKQVVHGGLIPAYVRESIRIAEEERPGPSLLELPEDVAREEVDAEDSIVYHVDKVRRPVAEDKALNKAVAWLKDAKHPLLVIGAGANRKVTSNMLRRLVENTGLPFCDTQMGKGVIDSRDPRYMGTAALSDGDYIHAVMGSADLILVVGHDVVEKPPFFMHHTDKRKVIHCSYYGAQVDQVYFPQLEVVGDVGNAIWRISEAIKSKPSTWDLRYFQYVREQMLANQDWQTKCSDFPLPPPLFVSLLRGAVPEKGIVCLDNGLYKVWMARQYPAYFPNTLLLDNALATMGAGVPSAMAAKIVHPEVPVIAVVGDGGFLMNGAQELGTAIANGIDITIVILNDNCYGMIKWKQAGMGLPEYGLDLDKSNPDFVKLAEAYGAKGHRITGPGQLEGILQHCLSTTGCVHVVEVPVDYASSSHLQLNQLRKHLAETLKPPAEILAEAPPAEEQSSAGGNGGTPPAAKKAGPSEEELSAAKVFPFFLASEPVHANTDLLVDDKFTGKIAYRVAQAKAADIDKAIAAAVEAQAPMAALASWQRREILEHCVTQFKARFEELARALCVEAGKPIKDARGEVTRLIDTFQIAMEECTRNYGEYAPMDISQRTNGMSAIVRNFPIGVISMVSPFNFPLNLTAHKVAPALAVGCPFVLKPASRTPIGALIMGEVLVDAPHLPKGAFSVLPCSRDGADLFTTDDRFKLLSFTGSPSVGWAMKAKAGKKKVVLELGGNAACVVEDYRSPAELDAIIGKIIHGGYYQSGQSCISVQRLLVRQDHYEAVKTKLAAAVAALKKGNPHDEETFIGPIIALKEAERIESWVKEAMDKGAKLLAGGRRDGVLYDATLLENVPPQCDVVKEEVFGPVVVMDSYATFKDAIAKVNDSKFGLQAGVFTHDMDKAFYAFEHLEVGGVVLGNVPSIRVDSQPYGGVKDSGLGREGIRYAMKDMTEERILLMADVGTGFSD